MHDNFIILSLIPIGGCLISLFVTTFFAFFISKGLWYENKREEYRDKIVTALSMCLGIIIAFLLGHFLVVNGNVSLDPFVLK